MLHKDGKITAFANILMTDTKSEVTVDLMRFAPDAPRGSMDFLFVSIIEHMREQGYSFQSGHGAAIGMSKRDAGSRLGSHRRHSVRARRTLLQLQGIARLQV